MLSNKYGDHLKKDWKNFILKFKFHLKRFPVAQKLWFFKILLKKWFSGFVSIVPRYSPRASLPTGSHFAMGP